MKNGKINIVVTPADIRQFMWDYDLPAPSNMARVMLRLEDAVLEFIREEIKDILFAEKYNK